MNPTTLPAGLHRPIAGPTRPPGRRMAPHLTLPCHGVRSAVGPWAGVRPCRRFWKEPRQHDGRAERRPLAGGLCESVEDHQEDGGVMEQAGVATADFHVLAPRAGGLDAAAPIDDAVGA